MLNQIPIKTVVHFSRIFYGFFLAKSGIKFQNSIRKSQLVSGFGFSKSKEAALNSSRFEALEHLYATYDFQKEVIQKNRFFYGAALSNPNTKQTFPPSSILVGPVPDDLGKGTDANGLGCHTLHEKAVEHAVFEIIERHCLAQLWYGPMRVLEMKGTNVQVGDFRMRYFTLEALSVPFAVTIIDNVNEGIWVLGSAVRHSIDAAIAHAQHEAMMLIESSLIENGISYSAEIEQRILSLKNRDLSVAREDYFNSKKSGYTSSQSHVVSVTNVAETAEKAFGWVNNIWVIDLCKCAELCVVKVLCPQAQNPRWHRENNKGVPYDPFC